MSGTTNLPTVAESNAAQAAAWDGPEGAYWAANAPFFDDAVVPHHRALMAAAGIAEGHHVLDIGCGTGQTTRDAARAATGGRALGVDLSAQMLEVARRLAAAEGLTNVEHLQADAQVHPFDAGAFDVAISRTGAMFFGEPTVAFANIAAAMRPGARLALLTWQPLERNEWIRAFATALAGGREPQLPPPGAPGPFSLSEPERVTALLQETGFAGVECTPFEAPMRFGDDEDDAFEHVMGVSGWMAEGLEEAARERALDALRSSIAAHRTADGVAYQSAAWLITAQRR